MIVNGTQTNLIAKYLCTIYSVRRVATYIVLLATYFGEETTAPDIPMQPAAHAGPRAVFSNDHFLAIVSLSQELSMNV